VNRVFHNFANRIDCLVRVWRGLLVTSPDCSDSWPARLTKTPFPLAENETLVAVSH
jgi:hypothetical protein